MKHRRALHVPSPEARRRVDLLRAAGISQHDAARKLHVTQPTVNQILHNRERSERVARGIARMLKRTIHDVFPDVYPAPHAPTGTATDP